LLFRFFERGRRGKVGHGWSRVFGSGNGGQARSVFSERRWGWKAWCFVFRFLFLLLFRFHKSGGRGKVRYGWSRVLGCGNGGQVRSVFSERRWRRKGWCFLFDFFLLLLFQFSERGRRGKVGHRWSRVFGFGNRG
jgi:hypothetical protein